MKRGLIIYCILIGQLALAQPVTKVFAYSQSFTPGMLPQRDIAEEPVDAPQKPNSTINYYIYIKLANSVSVHPIQIWIRGKWYKIVRSPKVKTPLYSDQPGKRLLVPFTNSKVLQLLIGDSFQQDGKLSAVLKKMMSNSELILSYSRKGMIYYSSVKKISVLEPMQGI